MEGPWSGTDIHGPANRAPPMTSGGDPPDAPSRTLRLNRTGRRVALTAHVLAAGAWIGIDVVLGIFVFAAAVSDDTQLSARAYQTLELFAPWGLLTAGVLTLGTGVVLGLGTTYGLVRYWWVAAKLVMNLILVALVLTALRTAVADAGAYGRALETGLSPAPSVDNLVFPPIVSGAALVFATTLSVFKPWGRIRGASRKTSGGTDRSLPLKPADAGELSGGRRRDL